MAIWLQSVHQSRSRWTSSLQWSPTVSRTLQSKIANQCATPATAAASKPCPMSTYQGFDLEYSQSNTASISHTAAYIFITSTPASPGTTLPISWERNSCFLRGERAPLGKWTPAHLLTQGEELLSLNQHSRCCSTHSFSSLYHHQHTEFLHCITSASHK